VSPSIIPQGSRKDFRRAVAPSSPHGTERQQSEAKQRLQGQSRPRPQAGGTGPPYCANGSKARLWAP